MGASFPTAIQTEIAQQNWMGVANAMTEEYALYTPLQNDQAGDNAGILLDHYEVDGCAGENSGGEQCFE